MKGFSLLELTVVVAIVLILTSISLSTFYNVANNQALNKDVNYVVALIEKARIQTVNAQNNSRYSIKFASSSVTLFQGTTYSSNSVSNIKFDFSPKVEISAINLSGNTQQASFEFITGKSSATGTISFRLKQNINASSTIILYKTGLAEIN
ncbi:MAG: prepilin-type N-terminal cleavage/methylation domain-containing protein [Candidatus Pacebacteria bacterium]|nr:prepilin-type N-terminal cleavage/methylation domain-containing protein [Candidatus Paceibacterota bacterium]